MTRTHLLGAASAAALACLSTISHAATVSTIYGGGSTLAQFDYIAEFSTFASSKSVKATFSTYWEAGSGTGQAAFLTDDLSCDINKVTGANGGACSGTQNGQPGDIVDYGASDATLSGSQISSWATSSFGQSAAGNLIQLPSMGVGISFPVVNSAITSNTSPGELTLSDNDLCGIFSSKITDWTGITDSKTKPAAGPFNVTYRTDGSGTTFILTSHLADPKVCTSANTAAGVTFTATTTFATLFPNDGKGDITGGFPLSVGEKGSSGIATYLNGCSGTTVTSAIGYLSPDFTTVDPNSGATITCNGAVEKSHLLVAETFTSTNKNLYSPTPTSINLGLTHAVDGTNLKPPTAAQAPFPQYWVPVVQTVSSGYSTVGYTTFDFAQCYSDPNVAAALISFLNLHYTNAAYATTQNNNGFVTLKSSGATAFLKTIDADILTNSSGLNLNIENATACAGLTGR